MLETLAHDRFGKIAATQVFVRADVPESVSFETLGIHRLPKGWDAPDLIESRRLGDQWLAERRSAILLVPSVIARDDFNALVNPAHPDAANLLVSTP